MINVFILVLFTLLMFVVAFYASELFVKRSLSMPIPSDSDAEGAVLYSITENPALLEQDPLDHLSAEMFTTSYRRQLFSDITSPNPTITLQDLSEYADQAQESLPQTSKKDKMSPVQTAAMSVGTAAWERESLRGALEIVPDFEETDGLFAPASLRRERPLSLTNRAVGSVIFIILAAVCASFAWIQYGNGSYVPALWALTAASLVFFSLWWAVVDIDTMFLDIPAWIAGVGSTWLLGILTALLSGTATTILLAAGFVVGAFIFLELLNLIMYVLRGQRQGFGDTLILINSAGIPVLLTGSWMVGYYSIILAAFLAIIWWVLGKLRSSMVFSTAFAFGPWLAAGGIMSMAIPSFM